MTWPWSQVDGNAAALCEVSLCGVRVRVNRRWVWPRTDGYSTGVNPRVPVKVPSERLRDARGGMLCMDSYSFQA